VKKLRGAAAKSVARKGNPSKKRVRCGNCRQFGHNARTCKA
jgi:hypothetical protein